MTVQETENKILAIYGTYKGFSGATGLSVPLICQGIFDPNVLSDEEEEAFDNALNIEIK